VAFVSKKHLMHPAEEGGLTLKGSLAVQDMLPRVNQDGAFKADGRLPVLCRIKGHNRPPQLLSEIFKGLTQTHPKTLPFQILYEDTGPDSYYQSTYWETHVTKDELKIFQRDSHRIVDFIPDNSIIIQFGLR